MNRTYTLTSSITLFHADMRDALRILPDNSIDSCVCDPPYHLTSIVKRFGGENAAPALSDGATGVYARASAGFMGQQWDGGDIAFQVETWKEVLRVLKPGGYIAAFGAPRNFGRLQCAILDAGFEERDTILHMVDPADPIAQFLESLDESQLDAFMRCLADSELSGMLAWVFGTGFPKSHDVALDIETSLCDRVTNAAGDGEWRYKSDGELLRRGEWRHPVAIAWNGYGTALKPAFEPIVLARKPFTERTVVANVMQHGVGALNIDVSRIHVEGESTARTYTSKRIAPGATQNATGERNLDDVEFTTTSKEGRWPADVTTDGSDVVTAAFPQSAGQLAPVSTRPGTKTSNVYGKMRRQGEASAERRYTDRGATTFSLKPGARRGDKGSAARFFYSAKANKADRAGSKHPTVKPVDLIAYLQSLLTPEGGVTLDCFAGSGTAGEAAMRGGFRCILVERELRYVQDILARFGSPSIVPGADTAEKIVAPA